MLPQMGVDSDNRTEGGGVNEAIDNEGVIAVGADIVGGCIGVVLIVEFILELSQGSPLDSHGSMPSSSLS